MKGLFRIIFLIALSICNMEKTMGQPAADGVGSNLEIVRYQWTPKEGLPDWNIVCILQDSRGLMWIASNSGLFTFDGMRFQMVDPVNKPQKTGRIVRLAEDLHHNIWIARQHNDTVQFEVFNPASNVVMALHRYVGIASPIQIRIEDNFFFFYHSNGKIWTGNAREGFHYDGKWHQESLSSPSVVFRQNRFPAPNGQYWLIGPGGKIYLTDKRSVNLDSISLKEGTISWIWIARDLSLWAALNKTGTRTIDHYNQFLAENQSISTRHTNKSPKTTWSNELILSTGWFKFEGFGFKDAAKTDERFLGPPDNPFTFNLTRQFPDFNSMSVFHFDREGNLWASNTNGLSCFVLKPLLPFRNYLSGQNPAFSMRGLTEAGGTLYALNYNGARQIRLAGGTDTPWPFPNNTFSIAVLKEQDIFWIGGHGQSVLAARADGSYQTYLFKDEPQAVSALFRNRVGELLAGTQKGIWRLDGPSRTFVPAGFMAPDILHLYENRSGLWALSSSGLFQLNNGFQMKRHVLAPGKSLPYVQLEHLYEDPEGAFWIASKGAGLIYWSPKTGKFRKYTVQEGLSSDNIHAIYPDDYGHLWLSSDYGLMRFNPENGQVRTYFKADGIADDEFNFGSHFRAGDGTLFFGGINGITSFHPRHFQTAHLPGGNLRITQVKTFDLKKGKYASRATYAVPNPDLTLRPSDAYLAIDLSILQYQENEKLRYALKIKGFQNNWVYQEEPVIRLSKLPYGTRELQVRYCMLGNGCSEVQRFPINVIRPFYLRWPFLLLAVLLFIALFMFIANWRTRQLQRANIRLEQEVRQRTRQIEENLAIIESDKQTISNQAQELRSLDQMKSRFFANVTHELRTPLTLILGPLERLLYGKAKAENMPEQLLTIQRNALKLLNLVEELLDLSKMEANKLTLEEKPTSLKHFLTRIISSFAPYAQHRQIQLRFEYTCAEDFTLLLDQKKLEKICNNLLGNALKFTPAMGAITLSVQQEQDNLLLEVSDTGRGIDPEDLPFVFDRYYQSKSRDAALQGGTGIGLSLSREYARMFGGDLTMASVRGQGTVASLRFPPKILPWRDTGYYEEAPFEPVPMPVTAGRPDIIHEEKPATILVVEDDKDMLDYIISILGADYRLLSAENGESALAQLEKVNVDLVLSDVMMPEMDGFQLLQEAKDRYQDLPFILLTARVETPDRLLALRLGVDDYLTKPFLEEELTARLQNLLQRYETRRMIRAQVQVEVPAETEAPAAAQMQSFDKKWLIELEAIVQANITNPHLSVQTLADKLAISERTLQNKIKAFTGLTPNQYLTEARLQKARLLLEARAYQTVSEVCYAVGFKTTQYFAAIMKKRFGKSPSDYFR